MRRIRATLAMLWLSACGDPMPPAEAPANVVLVVVDSLRADHVGAYGYSRPTTPFLDRLADESLVFLEARAPSSFTRESISSLFTGRLPSAAGATGWRAHPHSSRPTLAERLAAHGYRTGFFANTIVLGHEAFGRGFEAVVRPNEDWDTSGGNAELSDRALRWVDDVARSPFLLYVHYLDPHGPYDPPTRLGARFSRERPSSPLHLYRDALARLPELTSDGLAPGDPRFEDLVDRYDAEIADVDRALERLWTGLVRRGLAGRTWVLITADHGEEFLEHGSFEHAWTLYEESVRIPLLLRAPSGTESGRVAGAASLVDVVPTMLHGLGFEAPSLDGRSLLIAEDNGWKGRASGSYTGELLIAHRNVVRSHVEDGFKYVEVLRWQAPEERRFGDKRGARTAAAVDLNALPLRKELYALDADPNEQRNVLDSHPEIADALAEKLARRVAGPRPAAVGQERRNVPTDEERRRLRALGYEGG